MEPQGNQAVTGPGLNVMSGKVMLETGVNTQSCSLGRGLITGLGINLYGEESSH